MKAEEFQNHVIFEKLELLKSTIEDKENREEFESENLNFFHAVHDYILGRLQNTMPTLVQETDLTTASNELTNGINQINTFLGNKNVGHLTNANNNFNSSLSRVRNLPYPNPSDEFNFSSEIIRFQSLIKEKNEELNTQTGKLKSELSDLESKIEARKSELGTIEQTIAAKQTEVNNLNTNFETKFEADRTSFSTKFEADRSSFSTQFEADKKKFEENANSTKEKLDKKLADAEKIVNVIGNVGATGNFQKIANSHKSAANIWRIIALLFMAGFSGLLIWTLIELGENDFDWRKSIIRLIAAAALSYPATYAARESTKHRKLENYNRKIELELASIESFIEILDDSKKQSIKEKLAEKYFGSTLDQFEDSDLKRDNDFSIGSFERVINAVSKLVEKK